MLKKENKNACTWKKHKKHMHMGREISGLHLVECGTILLERHENQGEGSNPREISIERDISYMIVHLDVHLVIYII